MTDAATCVFCNPEAERVFYRGPRLIGLWSKFEVAAGHALVIPVRHVASWFDLYPVERLDVDHVLNVAREEVMRRWGADGFNIGVNVGAAAGQTVMHAHMHLIPRRAGDVEDPRGGVRNVIPKKGNYLADQAKALQDAGAFVSPPLPSIPVDTSASIMSLDDNPFVPPARDPKDKSPLNPIREGYCNYMTQTLHGNMICTRKKHKNGPCAMDHHDCRDCGRHHGVCSNCGATHGDSHEKSCRWSG